MPSSFIKSTQKVCLKGILFSSSNTKYSFQFYHLNQFCLGFHTSFRIWVGSQRLNNISVFSTSVKMFSSTAKGLIISTVFPRLSRCFLQLTEIISRFLSGVVDDSVDIAIWIIRTVLRRISKTWLIKRNPKFRRACFYNSPSLLNQIQRSNTDTKGISILGPFPNIPIC